MGYFPRGDAERASKITKPELPLRPSEFGPVFDMENSKKPICPFDPDLYHQVYRGPSEETGEAIEPTPPAVVSSRYLYPSLARNERLRLTLLWYHTWQIEQDEILLAKIDTLVKGLQQAIGWEYAIAGILNESTYTRLATAHLPIARLPRREATCAHTINQKFSTVFMVTDLAKDWRFKKSPHVEIGGLRSYAGTQLRLMADDGEEVALGSLCVASDTPQPPLSQLQRDLVVRFAELISSTIASHTRQRRLREREAMGNLLVTLESEVALDYEKNALNVVQQAYPEASVSLQVSMDGMLNINGQSAIPFSQVVQGLWEDTQYIEDMIKSSNYAEFTTTQTVRVVAARCASTDKYLVVASSKIHRVFDDFDAWYVSKAASIIGSTLQKRLLQQALEARENFLRGMTHQLRTPIHGILGSVELLAEELTTRRFMDSGYSSADGNSISTSPSACIATIKNSAQELMTTVNNILKHNTWTDTLRQCRLEPYDLNKLEDDVLPEVLALLPSEQLRGVSIDFRLQIPGDRCIYVTDAPMLKECLQAIVLNATQAVLGHASGMVSVTVRCTSDFSCLMIDVVDNGLGIHYANQRRIFEPYEKVDSHKPGAGLGLTLSSKIANTLNGTVMLVSSTIGSGSHFRVEFPKPAITCSPDLGAKSAFPLRHLPRTFANLQQEEFRSHFNNHITHYLTRNHFQHTGIEGAGVLLTDGISQDAIMELRALNPMAAIIDCKPSYSNGDSGSFISQLSLIGPIHTQTMDNILYKADRLYKDTCDKLAKKQMDRDTRAVSLNVWTPYYRSTKVESPEGISITRLGLQDDTVTLGYNYTPPFRALLVDDNVINLRVLQMFCHKRRIPYATAEDGDLAFEQYTKAATAKTPFTLVLMDLQMPRCDGLQATTAIRAYEKQSGLSGSTIFTITGQDSVKDKAGSRAAGADEFLVKPVSPKELDQHIKRYFPNYTSSI